MKNRLLWLLLLSIIIFVWFIWLLDREEKKKNNLKKEVKTWTLVEKNTILKKLEEEKKQQINSWKIEELKNISSNYAYFNVNSEKFYFNIIWEKLELKNEENSLWFFDVVLKKDLKISEIFWAEKYFLIEIWEKKYIYSIDYWFLKNFETKLKIDFSKYSSWNFIFFSEGKWSFVLYKDKNELEYFALFNDFIFYKNWYIWIIYSSDSEKKSRFSLYWNKNFILYFEPNTKEQKVIYEIDFWVKKIYELENKIFLENDSWEKFFLENF